MATTFYSTLNTNRFHTSLPGPTRKREPHPYLYRITYRNTQVQESGCIMTWEVDGGRMPYQVALEREENGNLRWHCTCADAVYRGDLEGHVCKHVQGLLSVGRPRREEREHCST